MSNQKILGFGFELGILIFLGIWVWVVKKPIANSEKVNLKYKKFFGVEYKLKNLFLKFKL